MSKIDDIKQGEQDLSLRRLVTVEPTDELEVGTYVSTRGGEFLNFLLTVTAPTRIADIDIEEDKEGPTYTVGTLLDALPNVKKVFETTEKVAKTALRELADRFRQRA